MSSNVRILLIVFSLLLLILVLRLISGRKLPIKYSLIWILSSLLIFIVGVFPYLATSITKMLGFVATSNFVIGVLLTLLLMITLILTIIVSMQKNQIKLLIQEVSILKSSKSMKGKE